MSEVPLYHPSTGVPRFLMVRVSDLPVWTERWRGRRSRPRSARMCASPTDSGVNVSKKIRGSWKFVTQEIRNCRIRISCPGILNSDFGFRISGFEFRDSDLGFRSSVFGPARLDRAMERAEKSSSDRTHVCFT